MRTLTKCSIICIFTLLASCSDTPALSQMDLQRVTALDDIVAKLQAWADLGSYSFKELAAHRQELATATSKTESLYNSVYLTSLNRLLNQAYLNWGEKIGVIGDSPRNIAGVIKCDSWQEILPPDVKDLCRNKMSDESMANWRAHSIRMFPAIPVLTKKISEEISKL